MSRFVPDYREWSPLGRLMFWGATAGVVCIAMLGAGCAMLLRGVS